MSEITICPFRTYTEVRPAILRGRGDFTLMGFMNCLKEKCPAFFSENGEEHCKRLAQPERSTGRWIPMDDNYKYGNLSTCLYFYPICSECGHTGDFGMKFCSNCGCRMIEVEND